MRRVLVSACLLGERVRHDGGHKAVEHPVLQRWRAEGRLVPACPEMAGGLPVPRPAAEIDAPGGGTAVLAGRARVRTAAGADVTPAFVDGAQRVLAQVRALGIAVAVLKDGSPSCGPTQVHDGAFAGRRIAGEGVTAALLRQAGVQVFGEDQLEAADLALAATMRAP